MPVLASSKGEKTRYSARQPGAPAQLPHRPAGCLFASGYAFEESSSRRLPKLRRRPPRCPLRLPTFSAFPPLFHESRDIPRADRGQDEAAEPDCIPCASLLFFPSSSSRRDYAARHEARCLHMSEVVAIAVRVSAARYRVVNHAARRVEGAAKGKCKCSRFSLETPV